MKKPLHNTGSVPSTGPLPVADMINLLPFPSLFTKAVPNEDVQFQADARELLIEIRRNNPDAAIILVGHSMGGDAVARLAASLDDPNIMPEDVPLVDIALLAPIDPVGNRSCVREYSWVGIPFCNGAFNFTRWRATHLEWLHTNLLDFSPPRRAFDDNIKYLYHRWQQEFAPPFDWGCPPGSRYWDCFSGKEYDE
jgi:pimeloyl-ACP methyl ester carboxylesterase